jgi:hypothetical protein
MQFRTTLVAALAAATSLASNAQWWNSADPTPLKYRGTAMEIKPVYDRRMRDLAAMEANAALVDGKFDIVDRMYDDFAANGGLRRTDGGWMLESIHTMFAQRCDTMDDRAARKELDKWAAARPGSKLRPVVEVMTLQCQAWKARGGGYANEVAGEAMQIFHEKLRKAAKALEETEAVGKESPLWWWAALGIAGSSGMPPEQFDALFAEAARRFPSYQPLYQTRVNFLLPQWGGDFAEVERFATESLAFSHDKEGDAMYAWIYVDLGRKVPDLFGSSASWPRMKKAFEDLNQRYPDAWNKNLFATFACRARDKETTGRLLLELADKAQLGAYSSGVTTESCRRFAVMAS